MQPLLLPMLVNWHIVLAQLEGYHLDHRDRFSKIPLAHMFVASYLSAVTQSRSREYEADKAHRLR